MAPRRPPQSSRLARRGHFLNDPPVRLSDTDATTEDLAVGILSTALRRPETYTGHLREALATARCAGLYPFGLLEAALSTGTPSGDVVHDTPVLLVHGYGHNRSGWFMLERALRRAGFTSVHTMNYVAWGAEGVPQLAGRVAARVEAIRTLTGADKVHLVGHSLGGVLIRWFVQELGGDRVVDLSLIHI